MTSAGQLGLQLLLLCLQLGLVGSCKGRKVFTSSWGIITDGAGKYPPSAHCEWLIIANETGKLINLEFVSMETECSYDYLFVYDGNSYDSPLVGSYSGETLPDNIVATSGYMLIYFYSDRNYFLTGFYAKFSVTDCPFNCSSRGSCDVNTHTCVCEPGRAGDACERDTCPDMCGTHGTCTSPLAFGTAECVCDAGYVGDDCAMATNSSHGRSTWYRLSPTGVRPRAGHVGAWIEHLGALYLFGGYTHNDVLDELVRYDFAGGQYKTLYRSSPWPAARYQAAAATANMNFYVFGGILSNGDHSNELWLYNTANNGWSLLAEQSAVVPRPVASPTITHVPATGDPSAGHLYLFGGRTTDGQFLSDMFRLKLGQSSAGWTRVVPRGGKTQDRRLVGHSTVFHPESRSLLVFGGFLPDNARFPKRTNLLHAFHIDGEYWSLLSSPDLSVEPPKDRAFHSAVVIGNYMVLYGGNAHIHNDEEICYDGAIHFYHLGCHRWVDHKQLEDAFPGGVNADHKGRFSHVAVAAFGNTLLISGGYKGSMLGDLVAYTVPTAVARNKNDPLYNTDVCHEYSNQDHCLADPECVWCLKKPADSTQGCIHRASKQLCLSSVRSGSCPGVCPALSDCGACTVFGQGSVTTATTALSLWHGEACAWCVKEAQCQPRSEPRGACNTSLSEGTKSGLAGWWGHNSSRPTRVEDCRLLDQPAGLHWLRYRFPPNFSQPDEVEIIRQTTVALKFEHDFERENVEQGEYTAKFSGFLHPLGAMSSNSLPLQVWLMAQNAQSSLYIAPNDRIEDKEEVASVEQQSYAHSQAERPGGGTIFPHEERGYRYYVEQIAFQSIAGRGMTQVVSTMQLEWTGALKDTSMIRQPFSAEFLQPFSSASSGEACAGYSSCLACMTDTVCGWCPLVEECQPRTGASDSCAAHHLVLHPLSCAVCADHVSCSACAADTRCEWLVDDARCTRRGRYSDAVTVPTECPPPCQHHTSCASCVGLKTECAWCEQHQVCFPFVEYVMRYAFGGCTHWIDSMSNQECHDCSKHTTCGECQAEYQCGWCGNTDNPIIGVCLHGDFVGPAGGESECAAAIAEAHNTSLSDPSAWSYGACPDVEECRLGLDDCHDNATCVNTPTAYECVCNRGFSGDGRETCDRTCYHDCLFGLCSGPPSFTCLCDVGWTGLECATNCGCHNHSTCLGGVGTCDTCQHWTEGATCERCVQGSYGDATAEIGCSECECNGHADPERGFCDNVTGSCYCTHNTRGQHCEMCEDGYYGDPRNGSSCYLKCVGRTILGSITSGALGTHRGASGGAGSIGSPAYCLWILTVHPDLNNLRLLDIEPTITFTMEPDIRTLCSKEFVYVYDGIPSFITAASEPSSASLLAAFCGYGLEEPVSVEAKSGYLTVYFEANVEAGGSSSVGFNASYHVNQCPHDCHGNRMCVGARCVCAPGHVGMDCLLELCPHNCSQPHGVCDTSVGRCVCDPGFGGSGCEVALTSDMGLFTPVFDPWRIPGHNPVNSSLARMGHTLVACNSKAMYMFGGYSLSHGVLNDIWRYKVDSDVQWSRLEPQTDVQPTPRYFHAAVCVPKHNAIYTYGGLVEKSANGERASGEMWRFSLDTRRWTLVQLTVDDQKSLSSLPPLAGHTMTRVDDTTLYVIGGMSVRGYYSEQVYIVDLNASSFRICESSEKNIVSEKSLGAKPTGLYGHSAVYHGPSQAIYVYGGYEYQTDKYVVSSNLYALDIKKKSWSLLPSEVGNKPVERFFHAAVSTDDYFMVLGGRTAQDYFNNSVMVYRYSCNHWMDVTPHVAPGVYGDALRPVIGSAAVVMGTDVFVVGGFDSMAHASMVRVRLTSDLCTLLRGGAAVCLSAPGCAACTVHDTNRTFCYSPGAMGSRPRGCLVENTTVSIQQGAVCDAARLDNRDCGQHKTCSECLTHWPAHRAHQKVCQWCSHCPTGKCIPRSGDCDAANSCKRQQRAIVDPRECVATVCQAASCSECGATNKCMWTRQFKRSSEVGRTLSVVPIYPWNCVTRTLLDATPYRVHSSPPEPCPARCHTYSTCGECLSTDGSEGGDQMCVWSEKLGQCLPPAFLPLHCSAGECGYIIDVPNPDLCPQSCHIHTQCASTLSAPGCGWCAYGGLNGLGVAMAGGLMGPTDGTCDVRGVKLDNPEHMPAGSGNWSALATNPPLWAYGECPAENECDNGHHTCEESETCTDQPHGFRCDCKPGYSRMPPDGGRCRPVCTQGCANLGVCIAPDVCQCHFGFVGHNCSTECVCNKHSNCESPTRRDVCTHCHNNTMGRNCEFCKPLFVGNSNDGGQCKSCRTFCNNHSDVCLSRSQYNLTYQYPSLPLDPQNITQWLHHGPKDESKTICILCKNNTEGDRCQFCKTGFFRDEEKDLPSDGCRPCQCNGHSSVCDKVSGRFCQCQNNTQTPTCEGDTAKPSCAEIQCSLCADNFTGTPTDGHQCYREMKVEHPFCFHIVANESACHGDPRPLARGQAVFFQVQPKYLNVDIRIIIDVTTGSSDLFFSRFDNTFVVTADNSSPGRFFHHISIDKRYKTRQMGNRGRKKRATAVDKSIDDSTSLDKLPSTWPQLGNMTSAGAASEEEAIHPIQEVQAVPTALVTMVMVDNPDTFLIVRGLKNRLVITLPHTQHNLKVSRFFLVVRGGHSNGTVGSLVFYQDQPHINLFVFFSVFFSCFFLFLAVCVLLWKAKQTVEGRQTRHRHRLQMKHMASRPFGRCLILMSSHGDDGAEDRLLQLHGNRGTVAITSTTTTKRSAGAAGGGGSLRRPHSHHHRGEPLSGGDIVIINHGVVPRQFTVYPIAVEPCDDHVASVATCLLQLPCGGAGDRPAGAAACCLGSTLTTMRGSGYCCGASSSTGSMKSPSTATVIQSRGSSTA